MSKEQSNKVKCQYCNEEFKRMGVRNHERMCKKNPNYEKNIKNMGRKVSDGVKTKMIHLAFFPEEKTEIKAISKETNKSISDFCRDAIFEKIRRIEHPELFKQGNLDQFNQQFFEAFLNRFNDMAKIQEKLLERTNVIAEINTTLEKLALYSKKQDFVKEKATILNLLEAHKSLSDKQIIDMLNLDKNTVLEARSILYSEGKITTTSNGRWKLAESN